jgi:hypothetical protein
MRYQGREQDLGGDAEAPMPPDNWDEETQSFIELDDEGFPISEGGQYPLPGESPDPYWFND